MNIVFIFSVKDARNIEVYIQSNKTERIRSLKSNHLNHSTECNDKGQVFHEKKKKQTTTKIETILMGILLNSGGNVLPKTLNDHFGSMKKKNAAKQKR